MDPISFGALAAPRPRWHKRHFLAAASLALSACVSASSLPLDTNNIASRVAARDVSAPEVVQALELARLDALPVDLELNERSRDPHQPAFWRVCALAYDPATRAARRSLSAALGRADSAGSPTPLMAELETRDPFGSDHEYQINATLDLLGLLGVGRSGAAKALARANVRVALGELERAVWAARFQVERARVELASARAKLDVLRKLESDTSPDLRRGELLERTGKLGSYAVAFAATVRYGLASRIALAEVEISDRRAALANTSGLPPSAAALDVVSADDLTFVTSGHTMTGEFTAQYLMDRLPELRLERLRYAFAEANVRVQAAERWPELAIGPKVFFEPSETLPGGLLRLSIPFPGANEGRVRAALEERARAGEIFEEKLVVALARLQGAKERMQATRAGYETAATPLEAAAAATLRAARAKFTVDPASIESWSMAVMRLVDASFGRIDARTEWCHASLDAEEACGPTSAASVELAESAQEERR